MQIGVSTAAVFGRYDTEEAIPVLDSLGVRYTEVFCSTFSEYGREFGKIINQNKGESKMVIHSVHALPTQFEPQLFHKNERICSDAFRIAERVLALAQEIGATHYTFHGLARYKRSSRNAKYDVPFLAERLNRLSQLAKEYGVTVCHENVEWAYYNRPGLFGELKPLCPDLGAVLDIKQARISGYPVSEYIRDMGDRIRHVHVSDIDENGRMCLPGKGITDFAELFRTLRGEGFDGCVLLEPYEHDYERLEELRESYTYLQEIADKTQ